ncbi:hypothetical protein BMI91_19645 [Thioclava sediminum]|uniref:Uncharacterized protein n=1 Tax=Thioclava sediminum TaxID=1915319 RepID=A0ABX3MS27_9RHOB|nr:hypothetical protein [Thioclava sediminum]OOY22498.1 hypothetical protein BMI91_19645 [Thioclava sediminum]
MAASLYEDYTIDELKALRRKILDQRAKGVSSFSYNGQSFTYSSPAQMLIVAEEIQREITRRVAAENGWQPVNVTGSRLIRPLADTNNTGGTQ